MLKIINNYMLFILLTLLNLFNNYIIIPFTLTNPSYNITYNNSSDFILKFQNELNKKKLYAKIPIGEPKKDSIFFLTMDDYFGVIKNFCPKGSLSYYVPYESKNFKYEKRSSCSYYDLFDAKLGNDNCTFFKDKQMEENLIINMDLLVDNQSYSKKMKKEGCELDLYCGKIGLIIRSIYPYYYSNFINHLKSHDKIKSYQWGIFFFDKKQSYNINKEIQNKYDGFYIVGLTENDYINIFNTDNIYNTYLEMPSYSTLGGKFDSIYFKHLNETIICSNYTFFEIDVEKNYIICTSDYYDNIKQYFFNKYFENKLCQEIFSDKKRESMIMCDLKIKNELKYFPKLFLFYKELNFTFCFDYNDLFVTLNNKIYFLIISPTKSDSNSVWNFGIFLIKKYSFMFDQDKKQFYFIHLNKYDLDPEDNDNNNNQTNENSFWNKNKLYIIIILLSVILLGILGIIGFLFKKKICIKNKKHQAYELDDDNFDYTKNIDNENSSNIIN